MSRQAYRQIMTDHFPSEISLKIGENILVYQKQIYKLQTDDGTGEEGGLRYGENPGQEAALYRLVNGNLALAGVDYVGPQDALVSALADGDSATNIMYGGGKHPSKTNFTDVDSALNVLKYVVDKPCAVIIKHNNPSGAALGENICQAFERAWAADQVAAFGGAAVVNRPVDVATAQSMNSRYLEVVAAPDFEAEALEILRQKKDLRIFKIKNIETLRQMSVKRFLDLKSLMDGGLILQQSPVSAITGPGDFQAAQCEHGGKLITSNRKPTAQELEDLAFGWAVEQAVCSNSVLFVKDGQTVAIGAGGQDRVGIVEMAVWKAYRNYCETLAQKEHGQSYKNLELATERQEIPSSVLVELKQKAQEASGGLKGAAMVSDAFFPFRDGVDAALRHGITAIAHPGGSMRDWEGLEATNEAGAAMVFTGQRAFKH